MNLSRINLNLLVALDALLTERSVTKAGERIFLTQSAMSVALRQLRELFEDELLERKGNELFLTTLAKELAPQLKKTLEEIQKLTQRNIFDPKASRRSFTIGLTEYSAFILLPNLYQYLKKHAPNIQLNAIPLTLFGEKELLDKDEVDLAIGFMREHSGLESELIFKDYMVCASRRDNILMQSPISLETYLEAKHLCFTVKDNIDLADVVLANMGLHRKVSLRVSHVISALYILAGSDLLVTLPKGVIQEANKILPFAMQPPPFPLPPISFVQLWHPRLTDDDGHRWMRQAIKQVSKKIKLS